MDCEKVLNAIKKETKDYIIKNKLNSLVIGISGGVDSALVAAIAAEIVDELYNEKPRFNVDLFGISMPIETNKPEEISRANEIGKWFINENSGSFTVSRQPEEIYNTMFMEKFNYRWNGKISLGNIKARLRMIELYHTASINEGMVLSTDNLTEYYLGFWTLHGDVGDYGMIQNLWKTEVYELTEYLIKKYSAAGLAAMDEVLLKQSNALFDCYKAVPTDGLGITNSDLDQLGAKTYTEVDAILHKWLFENPTASEKLELSKTSVIKRHIASEFKRKNPVCISRDILFGKD